MDTNRKMTETISKDGDTIRERVGEFANSALEKGRQTWNDLRDQGQAGLSKARKTVREGWDDSRQLVQKHPGKAVGVALMVGAAIGALFSIRRSGSGTKNKPT